MIVSGGTATDTTVQPGGTVVSAGAIVQNGIFIQSAVSGTATGLVVSAPYTLDVFGGGETISTQLDGATEYVSSGSTTNETTVTDGGTETIVGGSTVSTTVIGGTQTDYDGLALDTTISGGLQSIYNPGSGVASNTILDSGASQDDRASANLTTINFGGVQVVFAGGLATSSIVNSGGFLSASSGTVVSATVRSGGLILLDAGAQGSAIELDSGGAVLLLPGATMVETVSSGGNVISSGVVDFDYSTDTIVSSSAAPVSGAMVNGSGVNQDQFVLSAGIAIATSVTSSGEVDVYTGGQTTGTILTGYSLEYVAGGTASAASVTSGSAEEVVSGGASFSGFVSNGGELDAFAGGSSYATSVGNGGHLVVSSGGYASVAQIGIGGSITVEGGTTSGTVVLAGGTETIQKGVVTGTVLSGGQERLEQGATATGTVVSSGGALSGVYGGTAVDATVGSGGTLALYGDVYDAFASATNTTILPGGSLDVDYFAFVSGGTSYSLTPGDEFTLSAGGTTYSQSLAGDYSSDQFLLAADAYGGTVVTVEAVPCYCPGTLILTDRGERLVEALAIGDCVITGSGVAEPIRWIGRRHYRGRTLAGRSHLLPICIRAGALGNGLPRRDLFISPLHALYLDDLLVPAHHLANGTTIVQVPERQSVEYIHIELDQHSLIYAEGALAETFLDDDSRGMFNNASDYHSRYPEGRPAAFWCAPRVENGSGLEAVRQRLATVVAQEAAEEAKPLPAFGAPALTTP